MLKRNNMELKFVAPRINTRTKHLQRVIQPKCDNNIDFYVTNSMTRLLLAFLLYIIYRSKSETYSAIESLDLHKSCPKIVFEYLLVPCVHFASNGGTNESQSRHSEAKCQLQAVRSFWNPTLNTLQVMRRFTWTFCFQSLWIWYQNKH